MHVEDLLRLTGLDLALVWGEEELLRAEVTGVTATDLADPVRYLQRGEIVLSGLVWWRPQDGGAAADRFAAALRETGAAALLAGEETHGAVPEPLVRACREHRVPLLSVPPHTSFRAITDTVYLRLWGDLSHTQRGLTALPDAVRQDLHALLAADAPLETLLTRAFTHLGDAVCSVVTPTGRVAATVRGCPAPDPEAVAAALAALPGGEPDGLVAVDAHARSPLGTWYVYAHPSAGTPPPRVLREIADFVGLHRARGAAREAARHDAADRLAALLARGRAQGTVVGGALAECGLPGEGPLVVLTARAQASSASADDGGRTARWALAEALGTVVDLPFAVGGDGEGTAVAVLATTPGATEALAAELAPVWRRLQALVPATALRAGVSEAVPSAAALPGALREARYALTAASAGQGRATVGFGDAMLTLRDLIAGVPAAVRDAFRHRLLGPLDAHDRRTGGTLLDTLEVFLAQGGSWVRTAEQLHVHVNTVHYRIQRIEHLTGKDLSRLEDRIDLRTALLCA
ncbi:helix-turn-helix domain-containing protein [Streptomyces sp. PTM05]|uniref:Helix-turn-helix domain-containing protein n=1 Tax=Streptantibioticus parmotrematis TaxID=2873249 RepID=A0ABS7QYP2_9ACTN|nr:PucR family transcriptional regulator [Streptantibioticus parmotrematis]MBY8888335.1 helix-turn-helix domain-containing protein [Streptantibioticus parmotrematis]